LAALQLSQSDRSRREKLAGMLGSAFEGERSNALAMLQKMADSYKVRIDELLLGIGNEAAGSVFDRQRAEQAERRAREAELRAQRAEQATRYTRHDEPAPDTPKLPPGWWPRFVKTQELNQSRYFLTSWETNFVDNLIDRGTRWPSPKQAAIILRILEKAHVFGAASGDADWEDVAP
jgi:hypothetical protein